MSRIETNWQLICHNPHRRFVVKFSELLNFKRGYVMCTVITIQSKAGLLIFAEHLNSSYRALLPITEHLSLNKLCKAFFLHMNLNERYNLW